MIIIIVIIIIIIIIIHGIHGARIRPFCDFMPSGSLIRHDKERGPLGGQGFLRVTSLSPQQPAPSPTDPDRATLDTGLSWLLRMPASRGC